jgi:hypothetical protein
VSWFEIEQYNVDIWGHKTMGFLKHKINILKQSQARPWLLKEYMVGFYRHLFEIGGTTVMK